MGSGLDDHDPAVAGSARNELWMKESDLTWEDRDIMRGLGINSLHHVSSSVLVEEMKSRAYGRAYVEVLRKSGVHTRFTKDGVDDDLKALSYQEKNKQS